MPLRHLFAHPRGHQAGGVRQAASGEAEMSAAPSHGFARALTRRAFVFGASLAAGGLIMGLPPALSWSETTRRVGARKTSEVTVWVAIEPDDTVHIRVARSEMGQGISTALPM